MDNTIMIGRKLEVFDPQTGQVVRHWDEAANQSYDNSASELSSQNVQDALTELANGTMPNVLEIVDNAANLNKTIYTGKYYKFINPVNTLRLQLVLPTGNAIGIYAGKFVAGTNCRLSIVTAANQDITYSNGEITFISGKTYEFNIVDNVVSFTVLGVTGTEMTTAFNIVTLAVGSGTLDDCLAQAELNPTSMFQWLLTDTDGDAVVRKMIWHMPDGTIVDSLGYVHYSPT